MPSIKALPKRTYGLEDVVRRNSKWLFSEWPFLISEWDDFSYSESPCYLTHPIKFLLETIYGLEDVVWRISRCLFSSENWMEWFLFILSLHVIWCIPISICSREYMGWKKLFEKFQEGCLLHDHLLYLSEMKEAFMSLFLAWSIQSSFCSWGYMVWGRIASDRYRDCCLVLGHPDIFFILDLHVCLVSAQDHIGFWRRNCLKNSKMAV